MGKLDGFDVNFGGDSYTLIIRNVDEPGRIMDVSAALTDASINIATMQVFRDKRGGSAVMVVETDQVVPGIKTRLLFYIMRRMHQKGMNPVDQAYWKEKGWLGKARPWKKAAQKTGQEN